MRADALTARRLSLFCTVRPRDLGPRIDPGFRNLRRWESFGGRGPLGDFCVLLKVLLVLAH
jgi:hypothetical protein